jgi:hypothetical protein
MENLTKIPGFDKLYQSLYSKDISLAEVPINPLTTVAKSKSSLAAKLILGSLGLLIVCYGLNFILTKEKDD